MHGQVEAANHQRRPSDRWLTNLTGGKTMQKPAVFWFYDMLTDMFCQERDFAEAECHHGKAPLQGVVLFGETVPFRSCGPFARHARA